MKWRWVIRLYLMVGFYGLGGLAQAQGTAVGNVHGNGNEIPLNVTGSVLDVDNQPLIGVNVQWKGTQKGTITDVEGHFTLEDVAEDGVLIFSYIGYETLEVPIQGRTEVSILMVKDQKLLDEVVIVGYGYKAKENLTGSVSQVSGETFEDRSVANLSQALQGMVPNLNIAMGDGRPGKSGTLNIRGITSINGGQPLVLIDGVPGSLDAINPRDVASVSVLKDAASAAVYGARAAFGVILVTTKLAEAGKLTIRYSSNYGISTPTVNTNFITDGYTSAKLNDSAFLNSVGLPYTGYNDQDYIELKKRQTDHSLPSVVIDERNGKEQYIYYGNTDWWHTIFRKWQTGMEHNLSLSGGTEKASFYLSGRFYQKNGIMQLNQDKFKSYHLRNKIDIQLSDQFKVHNNIQFSASRYNFPGEENSRNFVLVSVHALPSYVPVNPDGTATYRTELNNYTIGDGIYASLLQGKTKGQISQYNFQNTLGFTWKVLEPLQIKGDYTFNLSPSYSFHRKTEAPWSIHPGKIDYVGYDQLNKNDTLYQTHVVNLYGEWSQSLGHHNFKILVGANQEMQRWQEVHGWRKDLLSLDQNEFNLGGGDYSVNSTASEWAVFGVFNRLSYDYKGKYLFEFNSRYDGTSRFPKEKRFGYFPSFSAGWRMSEEMFFTTLKPYINQFKFRVSYGALGNQRVSNYAYVPVMKRGSTNYIIGSSRAEYITLPDQIALSPTWEVAITTNYGLDINVFDHRLSVSFDYYTRETKGMLTKGRTLPAVFGANEPKENAADLKTRGWEISTQWNDRIRVAGKVLQYEVGFNLGDNKSTITHFDNPKRLIDDYNIDEEFGTIWGFKIDGFFKTDEEAEAYTIDQSNVNNKIITSPGEWANLKAGDLKFVDVDGDGKITFGENTIDNPGDRVRIGNSRPRYTFGLNGGVKWNGLDLSFFFQGIGRMHWYPGTNSDKFWGPFSRPYYSFIPKDFESKLWTPDNPDAYYPRLRGYVALGSRNRSLGVANDRYLQNVAYIRLKNVILGYAFPKTWVDKIGGERCRFYISGENLFTLTQLKTDYIDPEMIVNDSNGRVYPFLKNFIFGIDLTF